MQRILEQHVGGGEFIDDLGIPGISPEPLEPTADNSLVVLFARHGIDPPLWLKASPPSNRVVSTSEVGGSYIRILRSDSAVFGGLAEREPPRAVPRAPRSAPRFRRAAERRSRPDPQNRPDRRPIAPRASQAVRQNQNR